MASTRRLVVIMFTDMVGYTALTQADEAAALNLLSQHNALLRPLFSQFRGREIKTVGDSFLVEFDSALEATTCAIEIQRFLHDRNASAPTGSGIRVRIGIHLGDVVHTEDDVFGDSINIASRIEPLAEPGGICVTEPVYGQVQNKIPNQFEKLQPRALKNVQFPVGVYRVLLPWVTTSPSAAPPAPTGLAVLPFSNISPDPNDAYFADGLTEEMITVLSHLKGLRVIARTSVTSYKSTSKRISQIGAELRVSSILEGSMRKAGNRLRVTAQLIDVASEGHLWSKTYDRSLEDVFTLQSELAKEVSEALEIELQGAEAARLDPRPPVRTESYLAYLRGRAHLHGNSQASFEEAKREFELAISLDPKNAAAYSGLADVTRMAGWFYPDLAEADWHESAQRLAVRALELDPNLAEAHASLAVGLGKPDDRDYDMAEKEFQRALSISPSYSFAHCWYAMILLDEGRGEEALRELIVCEASDPRWVDGLARLAGLLITLGRLEEGLVRINKIAELDPSSWVPPALLATYYLAQSDRTLSVQQLRVAIERIPEPRLKTLFQAVCHAVAGEEDKARALLTAEEKAPMFPGGVGLIIDAYAELGDVDACFRWIDRAGPLVPVQGIRMDPRLERIRRDPRYPGLLKRMNLA